uniref:Uncharacterized protein n=1 Tax=viral metagenome TaxID=1070528 RepID=A0A6M3L1B3_9ZZZZ
MDSNFESPEERALRMAKGSVKEGWELTLEKGTFAIEHCDKAITMMEFIEAKKYLMMTLVGALPLRIDNCPFCLLRPALTNESCKACEYSIEHRACLESDSVYRKIVAAKDHLLSELSKYGFNELKKNEGEV